MGSRTSGNPQQCVGDICQGAGVMCSSEHRKNVQQRAILEEFVKC